MSDPDDWKIVDLSKPDTVEVQLRGFTAKDIEILDYCKDYLEYFWAAKIVGILLECDFKDAKQELERFNVLTKNRNTSNTN